MCEISCALWAEHLVHSEEVRDMSVNNILCFKYGTLVSCDVEKGF